MASNDLLSAYIDKILALQEAQQQLTLTDASLREIASDMGIDEQGWKLLQQSFDDHRTRAQGFMRYRNWEKAIQEFEQALPIRPFDEPTLQGLAESYYYRWQKSRAYSDKRQAAVYAEKSLYINPKNDFSLRLLTEIGTVAPPPPTEEVVAISKNTSNKAALLIGLSAAVLIAGMLIFFAFISQGSNPQSLPVLPQEASTSLAAGERNIPITFIGSKSAGDMQFLLQEARFREYSKSSSFSLKGYLQDKGAELTKLKLRLELLDKADRRLYEDKIEIIGKFGEPARSLDLIPLAYLTHIRDKKGIYPHSARLSVLDIEWREIAELYQESTPKTILREGSAEGLDIIIKERESQYSEHPKERYVFHKLKLELLNQSGRALSQLKAKIKWFDNDGKTIEQETVSLLAKDQPLLLSGQSLPMIISQKLSKPKRADEVKGYQITVYDAE